MTKEMTKEQMVAMLRAGKVAEFNAWRRENPTAKVDLSGADLSRANLCWADLSRANLCWAELSRAELCWADLSRAELSRANLSRANLYWARGLSTELQERILAELKKSWQ